VNDEILCLVGQPPRTAGEREAFEDINNLFKKSLISKFGIFSSVTTV